MNKSLAIQAPTIKYLIVGILMLGQIYFPQAYGELELPVKVHSVSFKEYAKPVRISGLLKNKSQQSLAFKIAGLVQKTYVDEGQLVQQGQLLARLDLEEIDAQVAKAKSVLANAEQNLARFTSLQGKNALSLDQLQAAQTQMDVAHSDLTIALFNRRHAEIKAPAAGRILQRSIERNEWVQAGQVGFIFAAQKMGWVLRTSVTDKNILRLRIGDRADIYFDALGKQGFSAKVSEVAGQAQGLTQTFEIELQLQQKDLPLFSGFVGHGKIYPSTTETISLLPLTALLRTDNQHAEIYVLDDNDVAHLRRIETGFIEADSIAVHAGIKEGERVVIHGVSYLFDGRKTLVAE